MVDRHGYALQASDNDAVDACASPRCQGSKVVQLTREEKELCSQWWKDEISLRTFAVMALRDCHGGGPYMQATQGLQLQMCVLQAGTWRHNGYRALQVRGRTVGP